MELTQIVTTRNETAYVPVLHSERGLAITDISAIEGSRAYTITHLASGRAASHRAYHGVSAEAVQRGMRVLLESDIDWTQSADLIKQQATEECYRPLANRVRIAITPPTRWRYADQKRRLRPYVALTRRTATHEAHALGLPSVRDDLNYLHWRHDYFGVLQRPRRQPCTRFVVRRWARLGLARRHARTHQMRDYIYMYKGRKVAYWLPNHSGETVAMVWVDGWMTCAWPRLTVTP